jgi:hypothetical protein
MPIVQVDTAHRRQVNRFLDVPFRLYRDVPQWVPPIRMDARRQLDRRRHPFYQHSDAAFFLAMQGDQAVGRIAVVDNVNYNRFYGTRMAFFYLFECVDDAATSGALFDAALSWARARGLTHIKGPKGMELLDGLGLLVEGYEHRPAFGVPYNLPYYGALVEAAGFQRLDDVLSGYLDAHVQIPEQIHRVSARVMERRGLRILTFPTRRALMRQVPQLGKLYNDTLGSLNDDVPLTQGEIERVVGQILTVADPHLIKLVAKGDELVGFLLAYPDPSAALQRGKGRLLPFGWLDLLIELKRTRWVNINGMGVTEEQRGLGSSAILFSELQKSVSSTGQFDHADLVQIYAANGNMHRELRDLGVVFYKTHRLYQRAL